MGEMVTTPDVLARQMAETYDELGQTLLGVSDPEFAWEPVDGSWRVFRDDEGRCTTTTRIPTSQPAPFTTIG